ncbi:MAG: flotillin-like protein FloA [Lentisphaeria bacterium]|nr:flotillin-like protein FloA [Lentisphaeria bacterium]
MISYFGTWLQAMSSGAHISFARLLMMTLRHVPSSLIVRSYIQLRKAGLTTISTDELESHYMAHGNVERVVNALIAADKASLGLTFRQAAAIDLAGRDVLEAVRTSVNPRVIDCPKRGTDHDTLDAVAKDGIQLKVRARVTVRTNLERLVGGATEDTIIARVGEGIVTTIGSSTSYSAVLENPDNISQRLLEKGLDSGTAFEILSIDIADVDVGDNIGARLQADQAEADRRVAQAKAEVRRAAAVAAEQEMRAKVQEMQAQVVSAQAEVPLAMAEALKSGKLGVMDYYRMENIKSDTDMRRNIAGESPAEN